MGARRLMPRVVTYIFDPVREISPVHRRISSAWRVTLVFRKMCSRWVFAVGLVMPSVAAVSISVRPANRLASTLVSVAVRPKAAAMASAPSCASGGAPMNTAATAAGCSRVRKSLAVGMKDGAVFVGQYDGTAERIQGFGHPLAHDGADIEHLADCDCPPQMRQQQLSKLNLALGDGALAFVPADTEGGKMHWLVDQEEHHEVDHADRVLPLLKIGRLLDICR
jgi:hypothetical protein